MNPISTHGYIVLAGFLPMYLLAGLGIEFPMIGFPELDSSYASTPWIRISHLMTGSLMAGVALSEVKSEMSLSTFVHYHWLLSASLLTWQGGSSVTALGKAMFVMPHVFTLWSTALLFGGKNKKN